MNNSILFLYAGDQQGAWGAISYPRPNHFYIMPGILYCAQILRDSPLFADYTIETRHVNRDVESIDDVCRQLCANEYACLGFSCYTWNTSDMLRLAREYKAAYPQVPVMLGGPDVEPRSEQQLISFFAAHDYIDAIAFGESEQKLVPFVRTLLSGDKDPKLSDCRGYGFHPRLNIEPDLQHEHAENLEHVPEIFPCAENVLHIPRDNTCGLAIVYETTRGCPYRCIYCRFSMHSHKIRRFDRKKWESELRWLLEQEVECIHVADAVFDLDKDHATAVLQTLREHNNATSLFFYCSFQRLDEELARLFQQSQCQIGVGVQSTNPAVLHSIRRALSPRLFEEGKSLLEKYPLNFYTDLIFGLPSDSLESFQESFNRVMKLNPSFVMAFPLTLIQGTPLGDSPQEFEVHPVDNALIASKDLQCDIHYRNLGLGKSFSIDQLDLFDDLAITLFYYFQRFPVSLDYLLKRSPHSPFTLFQQIGRQTKDYQCPFDNRCRCCSAGFPQ
ncbi:MAG: B12-binding domain-containing radical SAM protein, partial [Chitinivibrionales bacterium]